MARSSRRNFLASVAGGGLVPLYAPLSAQEPYIPKQSDRPEPFAGDEPGFQPLLDGKTLNGWDGDPKYWKMIDGVLTGEVTPETILQRNTFIIWRGGKPKDFELKVDYRITAAGNSGINYRSQTVPDPVTPGNAFALKGYQFDIDGANGTSATTTKRRGGSSSASAVSSRGSLAGGRRSCSRRGGTRPPSPPSRPTSGTPSTLSFAATRSSIC